jgi:hypothetical protein
MIRLDFTGAQGRQRVSSRMQYKLLQAIFRFVSKLLLNIPCSLFVVDCSELGKACYSGFMHTGDWATPHAHTYSRGMLLVWFVYYLFKHMRAHSSQADTKVLKQLSLPPNLTKPTNQARLPA